MVHFSDNMERSQSVNVILDCLLFLMYRLHRKQPDLHVKHKKGVFGVGFIVALTCTSCVYCSVQI